jgi:hypothetical protein
MSAQHRAQTPALCGDRVLTTTAQFCADLHKLGRQALAHRVPVQSELSLPREAAAVRQPDLFSELVQSALARKSRPCRVVPKSQTSMFSDT